MHAIYYHKPFNSFYDDDDNLHFSSKSLLIFFFLSYKYNISFTILLKAYLYQSPFYINFIA